MSELKLSNSELSATGSFSFLKSRSAAVKNGGIFNFPGSFGQKSASAKSAPAATAGRGINFHKQSSPAVSCINFAMGRGRLFNQTPTVSEAASSTSIDSQQLVIEAASSVNLPTEIPNKSSDLSLPVLKLRSQIIQTIRNTHVTIISGATGSGKVNILSCAVLKNCVIGFSTDNSSASVHPR